MYKYHIITKIITKYKRIWFELCYFCDRAKQMRKCYNSFALAKCIRQNNRVLFRYLSLTFSCYVLFRQIPQRLPIQMFSTIINVKTNIIFFLFSLFECLFLIRIFYTMRQFWSHSKLFGFNETKRKSPIGHTSFVHKDKYLLLFYFLLDKCILIANDFWTIVVPKLMIKFHNKLLALFKLLVKRII